LIYHIIAPINSIAKERNEDHANGTWKYRIRYASGAVNASVFTAGAANRAYNAVTVATLTPNRVNITPSDS
jgi:hypothetical protein